MCGAVGATEGCIRPAGNRDPFAERFISVVIPNRNGEETIGMCLEAALSADYRRFEVIVVDDASSDSSVEIITRYPCRLIELEERSGPAKARNIGAAASSGELLFFIDNDCLLQKDALAIANDAYNPDRMEIMGGTYAPLPHDSDFFSTFQSVFINHFETKRDEPDYVATHAMVIGAELFRRSGGFDESGRFGMDPGLEDVEFSHRMRRAGLGLSMNPRLRVRHIFNFSFKGSMLNAIKKARSWTLYSLGNGDLLADSGTASRELKANVLIWAANCFLLPLFLFGGKWQGAAAAVAAFYLLDLYINRGLLRGFLRAKGSMFALLATGYYTMLYPAAVAAGAICGSVQYLSSMLRRRAGFL